MVSFSPSGCPLPPPDLPGHPGAQVRPQPPRTLVVRDTEIREAWSLGACIDAGRAVGRSDSVARRLHGAQGPVVGEGGLGAEAHDVCSRGKSEARTLGAGRCSV